MISKSVKLITNKIIINKMSMHNFLILHRDIIILTIYVQIIYTICLIIRLLNNNLIHQDDVPNPV